MKDLIQDTDTHFIIDGSTRLVKNESETKSMLVQYDHNSERFTFRVPRYCDNHDLSLCNYTRVHYINIDKSKKNENHGIDDVSNTVDVCPEDDKYVICSWLITRNATQLAGSLHFVIQFAVKDGETIKYSWNTAKYTGITIQDGINFDEKTVSENNDLLAEWENRLKASQIVSVEQTTFSDEPEGENVWTATFGDGSTSELKVKNGSRGPAGYLGTIETIDGQPLHFFVGTKAQYEALTENQKTNLFAIFTDDDELPDNAMTLYGGTQINADANLNNYLTEGNYYISGDAIAAKVPNTPISLSGQLKVLSGTGPKGDANSAYVYILQIYISLWGHMFVRNFYRGGGTERWSPWVQFAGDGSHATTADRLTKSPYMNYVYLKGTNSGGHNTYIYANYIGQEFVTTWKLSTFKSDFIANVPKFSRVPATGVVNPNSPVYVVALQHDGTDISVILSDDPTTSHSFTTNFTFSEVSGVIAQQKTFL
jgi:hypothetical protein